MKITDHIAKERELFETALSVYPQELALFDKLSLLYDRFRGEWPIRVHADLPPSALFLVVSTQMLGIPTLLLLGRTTDAFALIRRAIEATGVARVLTENPSLESVYVSAYPNVNDPNSLTQFEPTREYKRAFSTKKLFGVATDDPWRHLRVTFASISAIHSHAGLGALISQVVRSGQLFMPAVETDHRELLRCWYSALATFTAIAEAFVLIFRDQGRTVSNESAREALAARDEMQRTMAMRAPWMAHGIGGPSSRAGS